MKLADLQPDASVRGILPETLVTVVSVTWHGLDALALVYRELSGRVADEILYRDDEPRLVVVEAGRPWSFDGDSAQYRLVSEAHRIRLAHLFDTVAGRPHVAGRPAAAPDHLYSFNKPEDFVLAMVEFLVAEQHRVHYLRQPFERSGITSDFNGASVNFPFAELLARAEPPC